VQVIGDDARQCWCICSSAIARSAAQPEGRRARAGTLSHRQAQRKELDRTTLKIAGPPNYVGAGTVEFLMDADTGKFYFIEVNPRIQVEHTVTEEVTGIDIVKAQIHHARRRGAIGTPESGVPLQKDIRLNGNALQCRVTTEDPSRISFPITAASPPIAAPPALASASMAARPIPARSSPASMIRCWKR
jgi:biotin carboxylase